MMFHPAVIDDARLIFSDAARAAQRRAMWRAWAWWGIAHAAGVAVIWWAL